MGGTLPGSRQRAPRRNDSAGRARPPKLRLAVEKTKDRADQVYRRRGLPFYVHACEHKRWHVVLGAKHPETGALLHTWTKPFSCKSWKHPGPCQRYQAALTFARISDALSKEQHGHVLFLVLTLDVSEWQRQGLTKWHAFEYLRDRWRSLAKAIRRAYGRFSYVSTVEVHAGAKRAAKGLKGDGKALGWPHLNVVLVHPGLAKDARRRYRPTLRWFKAHAVACGFGHQLTLEAAGDRQALAGYVVKLAGQVETGALVGEVVKRSQVPVDAPSHFRRIRSSPRFLPPRLKPENMVGHLVRFPLPQHDDARQLGRELTFRDRGSGELVRVRYRPGDVPVTPTMAKLVQDLEERGFTPGAGW